MVSRSLHRHLIYPGILLVRGELSLFKRLQELKWRQWCLPEVLIDYQRGKLQQILEYASSNSVYYRERVGVHRASADDVYERLSTFPLLSKKDLQEHGDRIVSANSVGRVSRKTTGGSTGEPVTVLKDRKAVAQERAAMWLGYGWFGIEIGDRGARFWGSPRTQRQKLTARLADLGMRRIRFSAFSFQVEDLERFWVSCLKRRPDYFHGYVSMIDEFAQFVESRGYDGSRLGLKAIVATSEVLSEPQRARLERTFGARVQVEYGCGEVGPIAYECEAGSLHLMTANLVVEFLDGEGRPVGLGETGELVLTDLDNRAMPLVRYRVGDYGVPGADCECGRGFPVLQKIWGREYDFVVTPDGRRFHGEYFMYVFQDLKEEGYRIRQFQILQTQRHKIEVRIVLEGEKGVEEIRDRIFTMVDDGFREMEFEMRRVDGIERASSGKMRVIRNDWLRASESPQ